VIHPRRLSQAFLSTGLLLFTGPLGSLAVAQVGLGATELAIEHVAGSVYMVQRPGGGGNIAAQIGPDGVLLVDSLFAPMTENLVKVIGEVTNEEIRFLINTHIHPDHVGGNGNLAALGVVISPMKTPG